MDLVSPLGGFNLNPQENYLLLKFLREKKDYLKMEWPYFGHEYQWTQNER
jgi:hypothetical protein